MPLLFALTMFVSALLLFLVQPMIGKMVLPLLGGTPAVWNTCMVFYQALLLAGYFYAHKSTSGLPIKKQTTLHAGVMLVAFAVLMSGALLTVNNSPMPIVKSLSPQGDDYPFFGVIVLLLVAIGLPFFVVSTSAPLLQKWFAETGYPSSKDPYFLYAASNFGSLLALVAYPLVVEPNLRLIWQAWVWAVGYGVLVVLVFLCAQAVNNPVARPGTHPGTGPSAKPQAATPEEPAPTLFRKLRWIALGFVPSSLMLGLTTFVSTDMASIPLLWIIPLSLYLITFIIVFSKVPKELHLTMTLLLPVFVLLLAFLITSKVSAKFGLALLLHLSTFFVVAMVCHGELAKDRPSPKHLTNFFLLMSVGGMLGGLFNALVAPIVFTFTSEYPITLVAACFLLPNLFPERERGKWTYMLDVLLPLALFFACRMLQTHAKEIGDYLSTNAAVMFVGLVAFTLPTAAGVFFFGKDNESSIVLAIMLGTGLLLYGGSGPLFDAIGIRGKLRIMRLLIVGLPALGYYLYWRQFGTPESRREHLILGYVTLAVGIGAMLLATIPGSELLSSMYYRTSKINPLTIRQIAVFGIPAMVCYFFVERPVRFGAAVAALWLATFVTEYRAAGNTFYDRSFFGRLKIDTTNSWGVIDSKVFPGQILTDTDNYRIETSVTGNETSIVIEPKDGDGPGYLVEIERREQGDKVSYYMRESITQLVHGTTVHGQQEKGRERRDIATALLTLGAPNGIAQAIVAGASGETLQFPGRDPQTYYHRTGPVGSMFNAFTANNRGKPNANTSVACIGLGTGTLSSYGLPGQNMVFFEIDTHVRSLVEPPCYFTYIDSAKRQGVKLEFAMGDARISLERMDRKFGFMLVDAFSSDAIPAHLLTKQAFELYFQHLEEDGLLAVHISNRYLELEPVVERLCREWKLEARVMHGGGDPRLDKRRPEYDSRVWDGGKYLSTWIAIAKSKEALGLIEQDANDWFAENDVLIAMDEKENKKSLSRNERDEFVKKRRDNTKDRWLHPRPDDRVGLWTDDFSPIIPILRGEWRFWTSEE